MKTNEQLQRDVMDELKWDPMVAASEIGVSAKDGVITLSGYVDVRDIAGVRSITNAITLKPRLEKIDIEKTIRQALHRRATVNADNIRVRTEGGKVILNGKANTWNERREVEKAVWASPGVTDVEDNIAITAL